MVQSKEEQLRGHLRSARRILAELRAAGIVNRDLLEASAYTSKALEAVSRVPGPCSDCGDTVEVRVLGVRQQPHRETLT